MTDKNYSLNHEDLVKLIEEPEWKTILLELVNSEKMDPWNIDLVNLADKYLAKINSLEESNLRLPANAILASAILLRAKSKLLKLSSIEDEEEKKKEAEKFIEEFVPELNNPRSIREGRISLDELVNAIESIVDKTKKKHERMRLKKELEFMIPYAEGNIEERIGEVYNKVLEISDSQGMVLFSNLVEERTPKGIVNVFIPLLFLANRGKLNLFQEEFFGEIFIYMAKNKDP